MQILANKVGVAGFKAANVNVQNKEVQPVSMAQGAMSANEVSSEFWKANMLSFGRNTINSSDIQTKVQHETDKMKAKVLKANKANKTEALRNMTGPVKIFSSGLSDNALRLLNQEFAKTQSLEDIKTVLTNPLIPSNVPITITEVPSEKYKAFLNDLCRINNDARSPMETIRKINLSALKLDDDKIQVPNVSLSVSTKELAIALLNHIQAGREYTKKELYSDSPFFNDVFKEGGTYRVSVNLIPPPTSK